MNRVIFALVALVFIAGCDDQKTALPTVPVSGEVAYWKEGREVMARVIFYGANGSLMLETKQTEKALKGILIKKIDVPGCGEIKFQKYELGSLRGTATPSSPDSFPNCQIPSWAGEWKIGKLL